MESSHKSKKLPLRRAHLVGTSVVVTIDPIHVKRLAVDETTFFIQKPIEHEIILEVRKLAEVNTIRTSQPNTLESIGP
jgi:hypothetical protein